MTNTQVFWFLGHERFPALKTNKYSELFQRRFCIPLHVTDNIHSDIQPVFLSV